MRRKHRVFPLTPLLLVVATVIFVVWSIDRQLAYAEADGSNSAELVFITLAGNVLPFVLILLLLLALSWRNYRRQRKTVAVWQSSCRTLSRITLDLEAHDVTYLTIPEHRRSAELTRVRNRLNSTCLELLEQQEAIEKMRAGTSFFQQKVEEFATGTEKLDQLAQTHMASGNYYGPAQDFQTVFDVLIRPLELRAREILFFLEDIPKRPVSARLVGQVRSSFENLRLIVQESREVQNSRRTQGSGDDAVDALLSRWKVAEASLAQAARDVINQLPPSLAQEYQTAEADGQEHQKEQDVSLRLLRRVLGLPVSGTQAAESYLEQASQAAYFNIDRSWQPASLRPEYNKPLNVAEAQRVNAYYASTDELTFKARSLSARLDSEFVTTVPRRYWGKLSSLVLGVWLVVTGGFSLMMLLATIGSGPSQAEIEAVGGFFFVRYAVSLFLATTLVLTTPLFAFFLLRTLVLYLYTGSYLLVGQGAKRLRVAQRQLSQLLHGLDEAELNIVAAQAPRGHRHLSAELIRRNLAYVQRDINYYESLSRGQRTSELGEHLLFEIELVLGMLAEEYQDAEHAYLSTLKR